MSGHQSNIEIIVDASERAGILAQAALRATIGALLLPFAILPVATNKEQNRVDEQPPDDDWPNTL